MREIKCPEAIRKGAEIFCRMSGDGCGNVKFCRMSGRWALTEWAEKCPKRMQNAEGKTQN